MIQIQCYLDDTYCFSKSSIVISSGSDELGKWLALKDNIFHPQGGGQPADTGWINGIPVSIRIDTSNLVVIYPQSPLNFIEGELLEAKISAPERIQNAALHTAGHFLNLEMRKYGWMAITGHHFPGESRVVFSQMGTSTVRVEDLLLQNIEAEINEQFHEGNEIITWVDGDTRYSKIKDTEPMACAGTHVDNIKKIIDFKIKSAKFKKGKLRISYDATHTQLRNNNV